MYVADANSPFTSPQLERLAVYRAAVQAGFYTDFYGPAESAPADRPTPPAVEPTPAADDETD